MITHKMRLRGTEILMEELCGYVEEQERPHPDWDVIAEKVYLEMLRLAPLSYSLPEGHRT